MVTIKIKYRKINFNNIFFYKDSLFTIVNNNLLEISAIINVNIRNRYKFERYFYTLYIDYCQFIVVSYHVEDKNLFTV